MVQSSSNFNNQVNNNNKLTTSSRSINCGRYQTDQRRTHSKANPNKLQRHTRPLATQMQHTA